MCLCEEEEKETLSNVTRTSILIMDCPPSFPRHISGITDEDESLANQWGRLSASLSCSLAQQGSNDLSWTVTFNYKLRDQTLLKSAGVVVNNTQQEVALTECKTPDVLADDDK